ncbi:hypothetical protein RYZ86_00125 [Enterobacter hormaechei]|nr:hypothetical protein [Enterobacter hormaechei]MDW2627651.1 hypothetical protein [Enterobacter hormaechei]MDW2677797.1 hypothetical protein [Enterobacter hormaechei]
MARIALASIEAEPVDISDDMAYAFHHALSDSSLGADDVDEIKTGLRAVFANITAPPAPVSVPAAMEMDDDFDSAFEHGKAVGWNACRAAMLQAEPVSNRDELPLDYLQGHKDGLEWAAQLAEANHPQTGDWLYDDPIELARAIRKGPDIPEFKSVSVDEDDNFYSWFGRFWYENYQKNNYTTSAKQMLGTMAEFAYRAGRESAALAGNPPVTPDGWVMLPAEPAQAMMNAWLSEVANWRGHAAGYRAMIAAAPQQEISHALAKGMERYGNAMHELAKKEVKP